MSNKRIKLSCAAYKKAAKEKLEKTDNLLRKIPKLHSYFVATNPEKVSICDTLVPKLYKFISHYFTHL